MTSSETSEPDRPSGSPKNKREMRLAVLTLLLPVYVSVGFATNYIGALHAPKPHHVKVAIVGAPTATAPLARALGARPKNGFDVSQLVSVAQARRLVGARRLAGAYVPGPNRSTVIVATAASPSLANFVEAAFGQAAAGQNRPLAVDDVRPLPPDNASETPNYFLLIIWSLAGFLTVTALGLVAPTLPEWRRLAIMAAASLLAPLIAYLIGGAGYGTFSGSFGTIVAMLGVGALYTFAVAIITRLLQLGIGGLGGVIGSLLFLFLNLPSAGGTVAPQLLPGFWRFLNHFWIGAAGLDANHNILYFGGAGVGTDVLKILAWVATFAALMAIPIYLRSRPRARAGSSVSAIAPQAA
jgi:hypothetical protein